MKKFNSLFPSDYLSSKKFKFLASKLSNFHVKGVTGTKYNLTPDTIKEITLQKKSKKKLKNIVISKQIFHRKGIISTSALEQYEESLHSNLSTISARTNHTKLPSGIKSRETSVLKNGSNSSNSTNYLNTCLPLIPDVRQMSVIKGLKDLALSFYGISRFVKETSIIEQSGGPNGRANRYLKYQYKRLLTRIEALPRVYDPVKGLEICWNIDFLNKDYVSNAKGIAYGVFLRKYKDSFEGWTADERPSSLEGPIEKGFIYENYSIGPLPEKRSKLFSLMNTKNIWSIIGLSKELKAEFKRPNKDGSEGKNLVCWATVGLPKAKITKRYLSSMARGYWGQSYSLLRNSKSFQIALLHALLGKKRWYAEMDFDKLIKTIGLFRSQVRNWFQQVKMNRVWIESPPGKLRPLGVAPPCWRMNLKGHQIFLDTFIKGSVDEYQHAYIKGRGTGSYWRSFFQEQVANYSYIYEYDFKGFFNNVKLEKVGSLLRSYGVPKISTCVLLNFSGSDITPPNTKHDTFLALSEETLLKSEFIYDYRKNYRYCGLPQGSGISPILSIMCLIMLNKLAHLPTPIYSSKYSDDGFFFSNHDVNPLEVLEKQQFGFDTGCVFSKVKSGWVKRHGVWLKPLKMLGLVYDGVNDTLTAHTRGKPSASDGSVSGSRIKLQINQVLSIPKVVAILDPKKFGGYWRLSQKEVQGIGCTEEHDAIVFPIISKDNIIENRQEYITFKSQFDAWILDQESDSEVLQEVYPDYLKTLDEIDSYIGCETTSYFPGFFYQCLIRRRLTHLYSKNEVWFLDSPWLVTKFNETLRGKHYQVHNCNPDAVWDTNWDTYLGMSLHVSPYIYRGGSIESMATIDKNITPKDLTTLTEIDPQEIKFQDVPNSPLYEFVRKNLILLIPIIILYSLDFFPELCVLGFLFFLTVFFLERGKNQPEIDSERIYHVVSINYRNSWRDMKLFNFLMSGMYRGSFNPQVVEQDFSLRLDRDSIVGKSFDSNIRKMSPETYKNLCLITGHSNLNAFNLSSVGCALLNKLLSTTSLNERRVKVNDADLWIPTYQPLFDRIRWRRPGPSLIKPWARTLYEQSCVVYETKGASDAYKKHLAIKIELMKKNYVPEFTKPYLIDPHNIDSQTGEFLGKSWKEDGFSSKRITSGKLTWKRSTLIKLMRYELAVNKKISSLLKTGIPEETLNRMFYSEHDRFWSETSKDRVNYLFKNSWANYIRKYGPQRSWHQMQWYKKLSLHDRVGMVIKPKKVDWISWRNKKG